jgi:hypothetical protein
MGEIMNLNREFIYFKTFDKNWEDMGLADDDLIELENALLENPTIGSVISGTGGVRKMRFVIPDNKKGKSGGARVLYVDYVTHETIVVLNTYPKSGKANISTNEKKQLKKIVEGISKELSV